MRVSVLSGVVCQIFIISADPVDTAEDMLAQGLGVSVDTVCMRVFVGLPACVRARVWLSCVVIIISCALLISQPNLGLFVLWPTL